jgi:suppressor of fused-like protein
MTVTDVLIAAALIAGAWLWVRWRMKNLERRRLEAERGFAGPEDGDEDDEPEPEVNAWTPGQPGRGAVDIALARLYKDTRTMRVPVTARSGEPSAPLSEIAVFLAFSPAPFWHMVTFGLSDIGEKRGGDPALSGAGIELTMRVAPDDDEPAPWSFELLRALATLVHAGHVVHRGTSIPLPPGLLAQPIRGVGAVLFVDDSKLNTLPTSNGAVTFLQVVPLTTDEYALIGRWDFSQVVAELRLAIPGLAVRAGRPSILVGPRAADIERRARAEGSSQEVDVCGGLDFEGDSVVLDGINRAVVLKFLRYRVGYGRRGRMESGDQVFVLEPGPLALIVAGDRAVLRVPADRAGALADALTSAASGPFAFDGLPLFRLTE